MKTLIKMLGILVIMMNVVIMTLPQSAKAQTSVSFQVFYDDLSPYGNWVYYSNHGYVWIPDYGPDFVPYYSNGYWAYTDYGWTWVSYYRWGWAPFHYGRWAYDDMYGWFWVPDNVWGPAWVCWRTGPSYYGWVPLGPSISFALAIGGSYNPPPNYWVFVNNNYMGRTDIYQYYSPRSSNSGYISNSKVVDNSYKNTYISGPSKEDVEKAGGTKVKQLSIKESSKPGQSVGNNELSIYKPDISKGKDESAKPAKVVDLKDVKPVSERKGPKGSEESNEVKKKEPVKENEPKKEMKKNDVPVKEKIEKQPVKKEVEPKMNENKNRESQPNKEMKKQEQPPKMVEPKENENKNREYQPNKEIKKQEQPPKMVQPKEKEYNNPPKQPHREMKKQGPPPKMVQPNMNQPKMNQPPPPPRNQGGQQKKPR